MKNQKKKKHDQILLLAKSKLNSMKILTSKDLINLCINHDEFVLVNDALREYDDMKEEIKKLNTLTG